jgi:hypothetical protein
MNKESENKKSPVLEGELFNYLIDIDGTITEDVPNEDPGRMKTCLPFPEALETLNRWYDEGNIITFFTSRTEDLREITESWLNQHGFKYHGIVMGKPRGGRYIFIDNHVVKSVRYKGIWGDLVPTQKEVYIFPE